jgi:hypothetical protein
MSKQTDLINIPDAITVSGSNVGIGTSSPLGHLQIGDATVDANNKIILGKAEASSQGFFPVIQQTSSDGAGNDLTLATTSGSGVLRFLTGNTNVNGVIGTLNNAERMRITSSGNVGIGTSSPSAPLTVKANSGGNNIRLVGRSDGFAFLGFRNSADNVNNGEIGIGDSKNMLFYTNDAERMRIDASGNVLVGTTDTFPGGGDTNTGVSLSSTGAVTASRDGDFAARFNRKTSDGEIIGLNKDGAPVGNINTASGYLQVQSAGSNFRWGANNTNQLSVDASQMYPMTDNAINLGATGVRFKDAYLSGGVYLGGTGSANKLSDYEEGTFSGTATGSTYSGTYTKIGRICHVSMSIDNSSSTGTHIATLPFSAKNGGTGFNGAQPTLNTTYNYDDMYIAPYNGGASCYGYSSAGVTLNASSGNVNVNFVYETD